MCAAFGTLAAYDYADSLAPDWLERGVVGAPLYAFVLALGGFSGGKPRSAREREAFAVAVLACVVAFFGMPLMRLVIKLIP